MKQMFVLIELYFLILVCRVVDRKYITTIIWFGETKRLIQTKSFDINISFDDNKHCLSVCLPF